MKKAYSISKLLFAVLIFTICVVSAAAQKNVWPDGVKTTVINADGLKALVGYPEKKQPVLINFWATWCGPCHAEFPELVKIDEDYREKDLNFVLVSIDEVSLIDTRVSDFLISYEAKMPSYLLDLPSRREIAKAVRRIAPGFRDAYPLTLLFDENGKLVYQKNGVINPKILRARIDKVLPEQSK